ncbi:uncharacterized protein BKA55DRAFT_701449 [Fusarium redolens]|uniref:Uncharacterized protein n=1 Tax=Fusarium redolens TaxID=48865 RepID=A0A9P9R9K4_FUSRE|nr:uncharacterized protein BKA55DRAFT_701449 [Fusarium redolens]KAH7270862.1 hypothetical protein BKA55DRAFT_701449 [Fusarium redolens]
MLLIGKSIDTPAAKDLRSLALSSAGLFNAIRPLYYQANDCADFRKALKIPDVARMERNHEFGDLDVSMIWGKKRVKCRCRNTLAKHRLHRPIDVLLFGLIKGIWKTTYPHALMWLYWKGYPVNNWPRDHSSLSTMTNMMPEVLVQLLQRGTNENKVDGICGMIRFLSSQGISIPIRMNPDRAPAYAAKQREQDELNPEFVLGDLNMYFSWHETTISIALRSHCPPIVLEVLLQEYTKRGVFMTDLELDIWTPPPALKDWYDAQEPLYLDEPDDEPWFIETDFAGVLSGLYADLMEPSSGWREDHQGQTVDIWEAEMGLLVRYGAIDKHERALFQGTLEALRKITRMVMSSPGTIDADGKERFIALCEGI